MPGAPGTGVVVDLGFAELAAERNLSATRMQVWLAGYPGPVEAHCGRGVSVDQVSTVAAVTAAFDAEGPGWGRRRWLLRDVPEFATAPVGVRLAASPRAVAVPRSWPWLPGGPPGSHRGQAHDPEILSILVDEIFGAASLPGINC